MFGMIIANLVGVLLLFFFLWRRMKDDYHYERIFNLGFVVLFALVLGLLISKILMPSFWFWVSFATIAITFLLTIKNQKLKFFESLDGLVIGILPLLGLNFLTDAIKKSSLSSFLTFWTVLILIFLFFFLDSQYKRFGWYKSGRVGFTGLAIIGLFFLIRIVIYLIYPQTISFVSPFDIYISSTFAFLFFLLLYRLSVTKE